MNKVSKKRVAEIVLTVVFGLFLPYIAFKNFSFSELKEALLNANFFWAFPVFVITVITHILRAYRWKLLAEAVGEKPRVRVLFYAMMVGYLTNLALPKAGEFVRCLKAARKDRLKPEALFGTVILERSIDVFCLILIGLGVMLMQYGRLGNLWQTYVLSPLTEKAEVISFPVLFLVLFTAAAAFIFFILFFRKKLKKQKLYLKAEGFVLNTLNGLTALFRLKKRLTFLFSTIGIWTGYFFMTYLWFFLWHETSELGVAAAFAAVFFGGIARALPLQAGSVGAYHFIMIKLLALFDMKESFALALAVVIHGFQTAFQLFGGAFSYLALSFTKRRQK